MSITKGFLGFHDYNMFIALFILIYINHHFKIWHHHHIHFYGKINHHQHLQPLFPPCSLLGFKFWCDFACFWDFMIVTCSSPYSLSFKASFQDMTSSLHLFSCKPLFQRYFTNISPTTTQTKRWGHPSFLKMSGSPDCFLTLSIQNQNFQEPKPQKTTTNTNQNV